MAWRKYSSLCIQEAFPGKSATIELLHFPIIWCFNDDDGGQHCLTHHHNQLFIWVIWGWLVVVKALA